MLILGKTVDSEVCIIVHCGRQSGSITKRRTAQKPSVANIVAETDKGRGILGVSPKGVEDDEGIKQRKEFLWLIGYKE